MNALTAAVPLFADRTRTVLPWLFAALLVAFLALGPTVPGAVTQIPAALALAGAIGLLLFPRPSGTGLSVVALGMLLFVLGAVLSLPGNDNWDFAQWRFEKYFLAVPCLAILFFAVRASVPSERALVWGLLPATLTMAGVAAWQLAGAPEGTRAGLGEDFNPNRFGAVAYSYALLALVALRTLPQGPAARLALTGAALAGIAAGLASGSRGALLGLIAAVPLLWIGGRPAGRLRLLGTLAALALGCALGIAALVQLSPLWAAQFSRIPVEIALWWSPSPHGAATSIGIRLELWRGAFEVWQASPLFGTGIGDLQDDIALLIDSGALRLEKSFARLHGMYFDALGGTGAVGLAMLVTGLFVLPWRYATAAAQKAASDPWARFCSLAVKAWILYYAVCGLTSSWAFNRGGLPFFVPLMVLLAGCARAIVGPQASRGPAAPGDAWAATPSAPLPPPGSVTPP